MSAGTSSRRALVTGAGGFVGAVLARRLLRDGHAVTLVVRPGSDRWRLAELEGEASLVEVDLCDRAAVDQLVGRVRPERVFSLAAHGAYSWQDSFARMVEVNVNGVAHLVEAAVRYEAEAIVHAGSSSEYGYVDHAPSEDELPRPNSAYAVTKCAATLYCGWMAREHGAPVTVLRLYSAYGPWEEPRRLVPTLVAAALRGELPELADASIARDFVFVEDVADAFVRAAVAARPGAGDVFNVGSGVQTTLRELVEVTRRVFSVDAEPVWGAFPARRWDTTTWVADAARTRRQLGWAPRQSLEEGLSAAGEWTAGFAPFRPSPPDRQPMISGSERRELSENTTDRSVPC